MPKFFVKNENIVGTKLLLTGTDIKHIINVLRKNVGDTLKVADGEGNDYTVKISEIQKEKITADIIEKKTNEDSDINVTLYQSLPKADKMELIIQKCTELGINKIIPFSSEYTVVNVDEKSAQKKQERWQKIANEACKQCGRARIPVVEEVKKFNEILHSFLDEDLVIVAYEKESISFKEIIKSNINSKNISIIVGPEGGFHSKEIEKLHKNNVKSISLGKRILRTETAGLAMLSIIMYELGDLG